jgi:aminoglycoside 6-adenylyltransferase
MRSEKEMFDLILNIAWSDERIRAMILNGSRANANASSDIFQDFDVVYIVTDVSSFKSDPDWIAFFGEIMIMQVPEEMGEPPRREDGRYAYLMQFADGNRIDLTLYPVALLSELERDSLSVLLLDKDGIIEPFPPADESDYLPQRPTAKAFGDCCNEFWWVSTYVAKGLWRGEIIYAKGMMDLIVREQLNQVLMWHIGIKTGFSCNPGKFGKHFELYLEPDLWNRLLQTYSGANYDQTWDALLTMGDLFRDAALTIAEDLGLDYPHEDDRRVSAHLQHVRSLPKGAREMY